MGVLLPSFRGLAGIPEFIWINLHSRWPAELSENWLFSQHFYCFLIALLSETPQEKHLRDFYRDSLLQGRKNFLPEGTKTICLLFIRDIWQLVSCLLKPVLWVCWQFISGDYWEFTLSRRLQRIFIDSTGRIYQQIQSILWICRNSSCIFEPNRWWLNWESIKLNKKHTFFWILRS